MAMRPCINNENRPCIPKLFAKPIKTRILR